MKRRAILIGSPLAKTHPKYLEGVKVDLKNYKKFLTSSVGGAWKSSEITTLVNPNMSDIFHAKSSCANADIVIVIFSGHGSRLEGVDMIQLNMREAMHVNGLNTQARRQITILDCCRVESRVDHYEGLSGLELHFDQDHKEVARALYDNYIANTSAGRFTLFSCSPDQYSRDSNNGGEFSNRFFDVINSWSIATEFGLPVVSAYRNVFKAMMHSSQNPLGYCVNETANYFPIAVNAKAYLKSRNIHPGNRSMSETSASTAISAGQVMTGVTIGVLSLFLIAALSE
jgi:hypothetical protein